LRTIPAGNETNPTAENVIGKTVAYSYPDHPEEKPADSKGDAGNMDSPFDFVWKMKQQQTALEENTEGASTISSVLATNNQWKNYKKGTSTRQLFIPSLGLLYGFPTNGNNESPWNAADNTTNTMDDADYWNWKYTFEAGTDCVGFAQRSASYKDCRHYKWVTLPDGIMDAGNTNYNTVLNGYSNNRNYPSNATESNGGGWAYNADDILSKSNESITASTDEHFEALQKVVPGDIWVKDSPNKPNGDQDEWKHNHIAVVAYIPPNASELSVSDLMNQIILVEAEYNNKIQSVIKVLSIGDYNHNNLTKDIEFYKGFSLSKDQASFSLNCQSWAIRRLKCED
jgi:hypothetical protein